jgi:hypothetical protein
MHGLDGTITTSVSSSLGCATFPDSMLDLGIVSVRQGSLGLQNLLNE